MVPRNSTHSAIGLKKRHGYYWLCERFNGESTYTHSQPTLQILIQRAPCADAHPESYHVGHTIYIYLFMPCKAKYIFRGYQL